VHMANHPSGITIMLKCISCSRGECRTIRYCLDFEFVLSFTDHIWKVLECATRSAAVTLGMDSSIGSISPGKLADLVVYPPGVDLLKDLSKSAYPRFVIRGGRVWDASNLDQIWPLKKSAHEIPHLNVD
jgi:adenine deaminase